MITSLFFEIVKSVNHWAFRYTRWSACAPQKYVSYFSLWHLCWRNSIKNITISKHLFIFTIFFKRLLKIASRGWVNHQIDYKSCNCNGNIRFLPNHTSLASQTHECTAKNLFLQTINIDIRSSAIWNLNRKIRIWFLSRHIFISKNTTGVIHCWKQLLIHYIC